MSAKSYVCRSYRGKTSRGVFLPPPSPLILNRVKGNNTSLALALLQRYFPLTMENMLSSILLLLLQLLLFLFLIFWQMIWMFAINHQMVFFLITLHQLEINKANCCFKISTKTMEIKIIQLSVFTTTEKVTIFFIRKKETWLCWWLRVQSVTAYA